MADPHSPPKDELLKLLGGIVPTLDGLDLASPDVEARLEEAHPSDGPLWCRVRELCTQGLADGWLAERSAGASVRFGRLARDLGGYSVDSVLMEGTALGHTHPRGEVTMAFAWEGEDVRFDGHPTGWVVYPPGSHHVPTVTGGKMLFVYFLPGGEVTWDRS